MNNNSLIQVQVSDSPPQQKQKRKLILQKIKPFMRAYNLKPDLFEVKGKTVVLKAKLHNQTGVSVISSNKSNITSYIVKTTPSRPSSAKVSQPPQPQVTNRIDLTITNAHRQRYQELLAKEATNAGKRVVHFKVKPAPNKNQEPSLTQQKPQQEPSKPFPEYELNDQSLNLNKNNNNKRSSSALKKNNSRMKKLIMLQKWWRQILQNSYLLIRKYEITHFSRQSVSLMDKNYILIQSFSHKLLRIRILFLERRSKFKQDYLFYFDLYNLQDVLQIQPSEDQYEFNLFVNQVILQLLSLYQITNNQLDININSQLQVEVKQLEKIIELQLIENSMFIFGIVINEIQQQQNKEQEIIFENNEEDYDDSFEKEEDNQIQQNQNNQNALQNFNKDNNQNFIKLQDQNDQLYEQKYEQEFQDNVQLYGVKFEQNNSPPTNVIPQIEQSIQKKDSQNQFQVVQYEVKLEDKQENKQVDKQGEQQVNKQEDKQGDKNEDIYKDKYVEQYENKCVDKQENQQEEKYQDMQKDNQNHQNDNNKEEVDEEYNRDQIYKSIDNFDQFQESNQNYEKQNEQNQKVEPEIEIEILQQNQNDYVEKVEDSQSKQDLMENSMKNKQSELLESQDKQFQQFNQVEIEIPNEQIIKNESHISNEKHDKFEEKSLSKQEQFEEYQNLSQQFQENEEKIVNQQQHEEKELYENKSDIKYDEKSNNDEQINENQQLESKQLYNSDNISHKKQNSDQENVLEQNSIKQIDNNSQQYQIEESQKQLNGVVIISQQIDLFPQKDKNQGSQKLINDYLEITSQYQSQQNQQKVEDLNIYESMQLKTQEIKQVYQYENVDSQILDEEENKQSQQKDIIQNDLNENQESQIMNEKILETQDNNINQIQKEDTNQDINNIIETYLQEILSDYIELQRPKKIEIINKDINLFEGINQRQQQNQQLELIESIQERKPPNIQENQNQPLMQLSYNTQNLSLAYSKESFEPPHKRSLNQELASNEFIKSKGLQQIQIDQDCNSIDQYEQTPYPQPVNLQKIENTDQYNSERVNTQDEDGMYQTFKFQLTQCLEQNHQASQRDSLKDSLVYSDASNGSNQNLQSIQFNVSKKETPYIAIIFYNNIEIQVLKVKDGLYRLQDRENNYKGYDFVNHFNLNQEQFLQNYGVYIIKNQILCIPLNQVLKIQKFVKRLRLKCTCKLVFQNKSTFLFLFTSVVQVILQKYSKNQFQENIKLSNLSKRDLDILKNQFEHYSPLFFCYEKQDVIDMLKMQNQNPQFLIQ